MITDPIRQIIDSAARTGFSLRYVHTITIFILNLASQILTASDGLSLSADQRAMFDAVIYPLLSSHCFQCHGPEKRKSGMRFDAFDLNKVSLIDAEILSLARAAISHQEMSPEEADKPRSQEYFFKVGADSPETLWAYTDFDGTAANKPNKGPLKTWAPHLRDWRLGNRKLFVREMVARFSHHLALNWNLAEETTQTTEQLKQTAQYIHELDAYDHLIVAHTTPSWPVQLKTYTPLLGEQSQLRGASVQTRDVMDTHQYVLHWREESAKTGKRWVVANDEQDLGVLGTPPDPGYAGYKQTVGPTIHQFVAGLSLETGEIIWRTARPPVEARAKEFRSSYSSPLVIKVNGQSQAVVPGTQWCVAYNVKTGEEIWRLQHSKGFSLGCTPIAVDGKVIIATGYGGNDLVAIDPTGSGDVTNTHVLWRRSKGMPLMSSPIRLGELLYTVTDSGILNALRYSNGELVWQKRLGGKFSSSPFASGDRLLVGDHDGNVTVFRAADEYQELGRYELNEQIMASPIAIGDDLIMRTKMAVTRFSTQTAGK
jgi:outer membrane protein assembly factor BamB